MTTHLNIMKIYDKTNLLYKFHDDMRALEHPSSSTFSVIFLKNNEYFDFIVLNVSNRLINNLK